ncbi:hypothetical protein GUITHDRAFT_108325 [Guillardia theta CCMP2712]|uniref:Uncharacterized protein n=1 Tax=Guillardia theta (strain CCMP2712) TaxID=905079 RepID=L1JBG3_GUITC|nr:hypothetical protein GUITHDRAFT_108325 [Guillardia theta CCMP2712]EKX45873.1 hypothetical protein GUITHDRAFT_108325 [Guillardia theta CCMP2712]|eukprot:XP_005832853.1 hypothetical protein GUITHDRAFT_108325 [Guillardia theta CCMP2712]
MFADIRTFSSLFSSLESCVLLVPNKSYNQDSGTTYEYFNSCPIKPASCPANEYAQSSDNMCTMIGGSSVQSS